MGDRKVNFHTEDKKRVGYGLSEQHHHVSGLRGIQWE